MSGTRHTGTCYRFVVSGELGERVASVFEGMRIERVAGTTVLTGDVVDQSHLYGLLERIQELGIGLVSVEPEVEVAPPRKATRSE